LLVGVAGRTEGYGGIENCVLGRVALFWIGVECEYCMVVTLGCDDNVRVGCIEYGGCCDPYAGANGGVAEYEAAGNPLPTPVNDEKDGCC